MMILVSLGKNTPPVAFQTLTPYLVFSTTLTALSSVRVRFEAVTYLDPNNAMELDMIGSKILKYCAKPLSNLHI